MADQTASKHSGNLMMLLGGMAAETAWRIRHVQRGRENGRGTPRPKKKKNIPIMSGHGPGHNYPHKGLGVINPQRKATCRKGHSNATCWHD